MKNRLLVTTLICIFSLSTLANTDTAPSATPAAQEDASWSQFWTVTAVGIGIVAAFELRGLLMRLCRVPAQVAQEVATQPKACCGGHGHVH